MSDWKEYKLSDIVDIKHGYAFKGEFFSDEPTNNILVTPGNFKIGGGFKDNKLKYYEGDVPNDYILSHEDIIVTMTDLSKQADTLGFSAKVPNDNTKVFLHNQRIGLLQFKNSAFSSEFLYWLMRAEHYQKFVAGSATGATVKHTSPTKIRAFKFKAPSDDVVRRQIAKILSNYDDLIENNFKRIKLLEESAKLTYEEWFLRFRIDGEKLEIDSETDLPFGWETVKISSLLKPSQSTAKIKSSEILQNGNTPVVDQGKDFIAGYTNETKVNIYNNTAYIVFGDHTRILKFINFTFARGADGTQVLISNNKRMPQILFYHSLVKVDLSNYHYARHFKFLKEERIILPTEDLATKYENIGERLFNEVKNLRNQNQSLKEARDILLPRLMTGMIDLENMEVAI